MVEGRTRSPRRKVPTGADVSATTLEGQLAPQQVCLPIYVYRKVPPSFLVLVVLLGALVVGTLVARLASG